jgi:murein DD-endopeptidase MepM/ murein hydrolase activator NlpD
MEHEEVISEEVVLEPVHTVMLTGSKWREVAASGEFINPTSGILTSRYGTRWGRMHEGIDIGAPTGTPIKAADAGVVTASRYISGYGYTVILDHGNGINTLYGHASALLVEVGQTVEKNAVIARVGTSGSTTGSCLHFEVRLNGEAIDPLPYVNYE